MTDSKIGRDEKVCYNCKYVLWLVGAGQGVKCSNDKNKVDDVLYDIPSRKHTCDHFKEKKF